MFEDLSPEKPFFSYLCDKYFYSSESLTFVICILTTFEITFWTLNLLLLYIEYNDIPAIDKYRIQKSRPKLRFQPEVVCKIKSETIKYKVLVLCLLPLLYQIFKIIGPASIRSPIPSLLTIAWQLSVFMVVEDTVFFWTHYLFHFGWLYKHIHKKHHIFKQPTGFVGPLAHPLETLFQNQLGIWLGPCLIKENHIFILILWTVIRTYQAIHAHCGYDFPYITPQYYFRWFYNGPVEHDYHHEYGRMNYASFFTVWDRLIKTRKR
ncbi:unnamed protein product, partial [Rotaria sp. Silwood2]